MDKASAESPSVRGDTVISDAELTEAIEQIEKHVISGQPVPWRGAPQGAPHAWHKQGRPHIESAGLAAHAKNNGVLAKSCRGPAHGPKVS